MIDSEASPGVVVGFTLTLFCAFILIWFVFFRSDGSTRKTGGSSAYCFELASERCRPAPRKYRGTCIVVEDEICNAQGAQIYFETKGKRDLGEQP